MNSSRSSLKRHRPANNNYKIIKEPRVNNPALLVLWNKNDGNIGSKVSETIIKNLNAEIFCEIKPAGFYLLGGVEIENDIGYIPLNRFYAGRRNDLVIFSGYEPQTNYYQFLSAILDIAQHYLKVKGIYTLSSYASPLPYNAPRRVLAVYNGFELQKKMEGYGLVNMNYQGPPAISSYLIWLAKGRQIQAMSFWSEIPFYLASVDDYKAQRVVLEIFEKSFGIDFDKTSLDKKIEEQSQSLLNLRKMDKEVDRCLGSVELGISLSQEEFLYLTKRINQHFLKS